mgnify:CR=1 FL=1
MFSNTFLYEFVTLYVVLDPIAAIPIFIAVTGGLPRRRQLAVGLAAIIVAFAVLLFFIVAGEYLLNALHVPIASFQMAGAVILMLFGLQLSLGTMTEKAMSIPADSTILQRAIFPLAMPCIAGTGSIMTVMLLTNNAEHSIAEQAQTTAILALCLGLLFAVFVLAGFLSRLLGRGGIEIITRVFGLILTSIAITNLVAALKITFNLA